MLKVDAHQHFWDYHPIKDAWITDDMHAIKKSFLPDDLAPILKKNDIDGCIAVQADQSDQETNFLLKLADQYDFINGVVGWTDLQAEDICQQLRHYSQYSKLKGFRHIIQAEPDTNFMLNEKFKRGISALNEFGFTYDILIYPQHLPNANKLIHAFPEQPFVIDHLGKPSIRDQKIRQWEKDMRIIGQNRNVYCKLSGMVTEADWTCWRMNDFKAYLDVAFETFGVDRVMFGSDWPVCTLAADYSIVCEILNNYLSGFSNAEKEKVWGGNARKFYKI